MSRRGSQTLNYISTMDGENHLHYRLEKLGMKTYFADPYILLAAPERMNA